MKLYKDCNYKAIKSTDAKPWSMTYAETLEDAKSYIGSAEAFVIYDLNNNDKVVAMANWDCTVGKRAVEPEVQIERVKTND